MRLLTYNIHKGIGGLDRRYRLDRIIDVLTRENADFVCLQEVDRNTRRSGFDQQPAILAEALGSVAHLDQFVHPHRGGGYGNLLLSRWPMINTEQVSLRIGRRKRRGALMASFQTPSGPIFVANAHLGLSERERHWQIERLLTNQSLVETLHLPTLLAFDSNDWRNSLATGPFQRHGFKQVTSPSSQFRTFPAYLPMAALDKVFARGDVEIESAHVVKTRLARTASDHLPVVVDFSLRAVPT
jgi:endonuclease/exonuclease/phosphatase family metal-dependent hydrolase